MATNERQSGLVPLRGEIVVPGQPFRSPAAVDPSRLQAGIVEETHEHGVQELAIAWQQDLGNRLNKGLMVSSVRHLTDGVAEVEAVLGDARLTDAGQKIVTQFASAIVNGVGATIQQTTVISAETIGEIASRAPTGTAAMERRRQEERENQQRARKERPAGLLHLLTGGAYTRD